MPRSITRRFFLRNASLALAGAVAAPRALAQMRGGGMGGGGMGGGGMGGGTSVVTDPPVSGAFVEPRVIGNRSGNVVDVSFRAEAKTVLFNGSLVTMLTYDGSFVAPTIRARAGDIVNLQFTNALPRTQTFLGYDRSITNIHVHGWHVSPGSDASGLPADNVHVTVPTGTSQPYRYDLSKQRAGSIGLYHPHVHGSVAEQFWAGLVGALDVEDDPAFGLGSYRRWITVLKDVTVSNGSPAAYTQLSDYMHGKEGSLCTVNGQVNPALDVEPGEVFRLRVVNASNARFYRLQLQSHSMYVIGSDGGPLDAPYAMPELLVSPGERVDLMFQAPRIANSYKLLALPYARMGMMSSPQITLLTVRVGKKGTSYPKTIPTKIDPAPIRLSAETSGLPRQRFALSMGMGSGYINGQTFQVVNGDIAAFEHMSTVGTEEVWEIVNESNMDHPWHQHVNDAQVIAAAGGDATFARYAQLYTQAPAWKDTIIIPKMGSVTLRIPVLDYTGMTMFHCHILEHEDIGMMGMWHIMEPEMPM